MYFHISCCILQLEGYNWKDNALSPVLMGISKENLLQNISAYCFLSIKCYLLNLIANIYRLQVGSMCMTL